MPKKKKAEWVLDKLYSEIMGKYWHRWRCSVCRYIRSAGWEAPKPTCHYCESCGAEITNAED